MTRHYRPAFALLLACILASAVAQAQQAAAPDKSRVANAAASRPAGKVVASIAVPQPSSPAQKPDTVAKRESEEFHPLVDF